uniref:Uncharacterized protein n=1 Tax=Anguilla anguilla TaxID=7936 RepID=A0A0E9PYK1_ANGAN
MYYTQFKVHSY